MAVLIEGIWALEVVLEVMEQQWRRWGDGEKAERWIRSGLACSV